jgi:hypothetical protein
VGAGTLILFFGRVEKYHVVVEIDGQRLAKNVDVDVDQYTLLTLLFL